MAPPFETVTLRTPPIPCVVDPGVFDAFGWCVSDTLDWRKPHGALREGEPIDASNPGRLVFVFRSEAASRILPRELAAVHVPDLAQADEWVLAPYAIDDATDGLHEHRSVPKDTLLLVADRVTALVWGLHDWAHFHNHGAFERRAETELQCDVAALVWLSINQPLLGLSNETRERVRLALAKLSADRFAEERKPYDAEAFSEARLRELVRSALSTSSIP